ncbi:MAG: DUF6067 family protein, partial [Oscillospiraceae bacterium]
MNFLHKKFNLTSFKRLLASTLVLSLLIGIVPIFQIKVKAIQGDSVQVWSPTNIEKIRQEQAFLDLNYDQELKVSLAKNESEGAQLIIRNDSTDITNVEISVSDLTSLGNTLDKENISVFKQHYVKIDKTSNTLLEKGMYPDALIPIEYAVDKTVKAGNNQGYWFTVTAPKGQRAGEYTGTVTLKHDGGNLQIPLTVTIWDFTLPDENGFDRSFALSQRNIGAYYGLNSTSQEYWELQKAYYEFQLNYRATPTDLPIPTSDPVEFAKHAKVMLDADPSINCYRIPFMGNSSNLNKTGNQAMVDALKAQGILDKGYYYVGFIDEPTTSMFPKVREVNAMIQEIAPDTKSIITSSPINELSDSVNAWCSPFDRISESEVLKQQAKGITMWWYGCTGPKYPYPTYHVDDRMLSARVQNWMQKDYNITGDLYWCTNIFEQYDFGNNQYVPRDVWTNPYSYGGTAGDGYLLYPGKINDGVVNRNMPIGTVRLEAIRDGAEDYAYLDLLETKINEKITALGLTDTIKAQDVMDYYYDQLYYGTNNFDTDPTRLLKVREMVANAIINSDELDALIVVPTPNKYSNGYIAERTIAVYAPKNAAVTIDSNTLTATSMGAKADKYSFDTTLSTGYSEISISITKSENILENYKLFFNVRPKVVEVFESPILNFSTDNFKTEEIKSGSTVKNIEVSKDFSIDGGKNKAMKVTFDSTKAFSHAVIPVEAFDIPIADWSRYERLEFDVLVDENCTVGANKFGNFYIGLKNAEGQTDDSGTYKSYTISPPDVASDAGPVKSGATAHISVDLSQFSKAEAGWKNLTQFTVSTWGTDYASDPIMTFANFKLTSTKSPFFTTPILGFEKEQAISSAQVDYSFSDDWKTEGEKSLKVVYKGAEYPGVFWGKPDADNQMSLPGSNWSQFFGIQFDVYTPMESEKEFFMKYWDLNGKGNDSFHFTTKPQDTKKVFMPLSFLTNFDIDISRISSTSIQTWVGNEYEIYIDNIELLSYHAVEDPFPEAPPIIPEFLPKKARVMNSDEIVVDGDLSDVAWTTRSQLTQQGSLATTIKGNFATAWDTENLYVGIDVTSISDNKTTFEKDGVSLYISAENSRGASYSDKEVQIRIQNKGTGIAVGSGGGGNATFDLSSVIYKTLDKDNGYTMELAIPWASIGTTPTYGKKIGFDITASDGNLDPKPYIVWS